MVVEVGDSTTAITPVVDNTVLTHSIQMNEIGGRFTYFHFTFHPSFFPMALAVLHLFLEISLKNYNVYYDSVDINCDHHPIEKSLEK